MQKMKIEDLRLLKKDQSSKEWLRVYTGFLQQFKKTPNFYGSSKIWQT